MPGGAEGGERAGERERELSVPSWAEEIGWCHGGSRRVAAMRGVGFGPSW